MYCCQVVFPRLLLSVLLIVFYCHVNAQLCSGSLGDPVVNITFGSGTNPGPPLNAATTSYSYISSDCPNDGMYAIRNASYNCYANTWHSLSGDHTGNANGYFMLVNASFQPGDFYLDKVSGLCANTTYEFAAWLMNIMIPLNSIKPNITFSIERTDGTVLQKYNTGDIDVTASPEWKQYGFYFTTPADVSNVVVRITNNAQGGIGNDLALDDITFRPCGPQVKATISTSGKDSTTLCAGDTTTLTFNTTVSAGYNAPVYQWQLTTDNGTTWNDIAGAVSTTYKRFYTDNGTYKYRLTVAEAVNGSLSSCRVASNELTVKVKSIPVIKFINNGPWCEGSTIILKATISYNSSPVSATWQYPNANTPIFNSEEVVDQATNSSVYTLIIKNASEIYIGAYTLTAKNNSGCYAVNATVINQLLPAPVANFNVMATCENDTTLFSDQSIIQAGQTITNWNWTFDNSSSNNKNPVHQFKTVNTYPVSLAVKAANGCSSDTLTKNIVIHPLPQPNFGLPEVCLSDPYALFTDSSTINNNPAPFSYLWNFGDVAANTGNSNTSTQKNPQHKYNATGIYNVRLTVTSNEGCVKDTVKAFTVNGSIPKAAFAVDNADALCSNNEVAITDASSVNFGNITRLEIYWDYWNNPTAITTDESPFKGKRYTFNYPSPGNELSKQFLIRYVVYSGTNCISETGQAITINKSPKVAFDLLNSVCEDIAPFKIVQAGEVSGIPGKGIFSGVGINSNGIFNPHNAGPGNHVVRYSFTTNAGCTEFKEQNIVVYPQPKVSAGPDVILVKGGAITLEGRAEGNAITYSWSPVFNIDDAHIAQPKVSPSQDTTYTLLVQSSDGCTNKDDVIVKVVNSIYIPNAFTPNGDGINDVWHIPYLSSFPDAEVSVYNRWGQLVFYAAGSNKAWDGTFNGKLLPVGVYVYLIKRKADATQLSGTVTLIR